MQHLNNLKIANYVMAGLQIMGGIAIGGIYGLLGAMTMTSDTTSGAIMLVVGLVIGAILLFMGALFAVNGGKVAKGQGKILQTILSVLTIGSFPFGTAYAAYGLWVVWMNAESKAIFESGGLDV